MILENLANVNLENDLKIVADHGRIGVMVKCLIRWQKMQFSIHFYMYIHVNKRKRSPVQYFLALICVQGIWRYRHYFTSITNLISVSVSVVFSSLPIGAFQWPITSSVTLTFNLN